MIKPFYSIVFFSQNTFQTGPFLMQNLVRVFCLEKFLKARKIILMGAKWRVGDGLSIRVFKDNWLPGVAGGRVTSVPTDLNNSMRVAELIDRNLGWWNTWVIDETFVSFEAQRIKAIPLCETPQSELLYWALEKDGVYSVK